MNSEIFSPVDQFIICVSGILLPQQTMSIKKVETAARFVLLVEKHTVYEKLLVEDVLNRLSPCILITVCVTGFVFS